MDLQPLGQVILRAFRIVADHLDTGHALGLDLADQGGDIQVTIHMLAAGHGHRVVEQDLVGDGELGRDRLADGQDAGVEIGPVAQVHEHMRLVAER
jgi:hypothetical protein